MDSPTTVCPYAPLRAGVNGRPSYTHLFRLENSKSQYVHMLTHLLQAISEADRLVVGDGAAGTDRPLLSERFRRRSGLSVFVKPSMRGEWLSKQAVSPRYIPFEYDVFTSDTSELQTFLESHADDPDAFRLEELRRVKP